MACQVGSCFTRAAHCSSNGWAKSLSCRLHPPLALQDLGKALGVNCVVFNCGENLDFKFMGKFFAGQSLDCCQRGRQSLVAAAASCVLLSDLQGLLSVELGLALTSSTASTLRCSLWSRSSCSRCKTL